MPQPGADRPVYDAPLGDDEIVNIAVWKLRDCWFDSTLFDRDTVAQQCWVLLLEHREEWASRWDSHTTATLSGWLVMKLTYAMRDWARSQPGPYARTRGKRVRTLPLEGIIGANNEPSAAWSDRLSLLADLAVNVEDEAVGDETDILDFAFRFLAQLSGRDGVIVRRVVLDGEQGRQVCKDYGVDESRISQIVHRELGRLRREAVARFGL